MRRLALAGIIASALIILTGAAVRLSQSGLGCPDWPQCTASSLVAAGDTGDSLIHRWVEFGNRLVTVAIFVVAVGVCVAAWRFRRGAAGSPPPGPGLAGRRAARRDRGAGRARRHRRDDQAEPGLVSVHFLASVALIAAAVALYVRCQEGTAPARPMVPRLVSWLSPAWSAAWR